LFDAGVRATVSWFKFWLPVLAWMGLIFLGSCDAQSWQHSSRIVGPLLHWLFPGLAAARVDQIVFLCRKLAHLTEYSVLALLVWRALRQPVRHAPPRPWNWPQARLALLLCAAYAGTDEFHQLFVPTREARVHDVLLDTCGSALALALLWGLGRWRKFW
jgi:VanZ family protein